MSTAWGLGTTAIMDELPNGYAVHAVLTCFSLSRCFEMDLMMMIAPNSLVRQKEGIQGGGEGGGGRVRRSKKWRSNRNSDVRRRRSDRSISVKSVGCEEQEKIWTMVWGSTPQERQRGLGISPVLSR